MSGPARVCMFPLSSFWLLRIQIVAKRTCIWNFVKEVTYNPPSSEVQSNSNVMLKGRHSPAGIDLYETSQSIFTRHWQTAKCTMGLNACYLSPILLEYMRNTPKIGFLTDQSLQNNNKTWPWSPHKNVRSVSLLLMKCERVKYFIAVGAKGPHKGVSSTGP